MAKLTIATYEDEGQTRVWMQMSNCDEVDIEVPLDRKMEVFSLHSSAFDIEERPMFEALAAMETAIVASDTEPLIGYVIGTIVEAVLKRKMGMGIAQQLPG